MMKTLKKSNTFCKRKKKNEFQKTFWLLVIQTIIYYNKYAAINRLTTIKKSDLFDKIKWEFFQAVTVSLLLNDCTYLTN